MTARPRLAQIDLLKGFAMLGVIALHGLTSDELHDAWGSLHFGQAVPIFLVLMALNASNSFRRHADRPLRGLFSRSYFAGRFERLLVPFAVIWVASLFLGMLEGDVHFGPTTAVGVTPLTGPGNYFVTIAFEFVLVFPLLFWAFQRSPRATIAGCFAIDAAFELIAPHVFEGAYPYGYDAAIVRYFGQIALGLWIAQQMTAGGPGAGGPRAGGRQAARRGAGGRGGGSRWILALAPLSAAYLVWQHEDPGAFDWLRDDFGTTTNFLAAPYGAALVLLGLRYLPSRETFVPVRVLAAIGRASWHIFLVQMIWFALVDERGLDAYPLNAVGPCAIGYALYRVMALPYAVRQIRRGTTWLARA